MSTLPVFRQEAEGFRPVRAGGLPISRRNHADYAAFYAPGYLCVVDLPEADRFEVTIERAGWLSPSHMLEEDEAVKLYRRAESVAAEANLRHRERFRPESLTLYMNNECNLSCIYCHTDPSPKPMPRLGLDIIAAAAEVVAASCRQKGCPFYAVFHGGGEPTLHRERVERALASIEAAAAAHDVEILRYVATNGVMSEGKAAWLAHRFDLIGLSCDGPADIHNQQRLRWGGEGTLRTVERTGRILREEGAQVHVRTTVTETSLERQAEIAEYICQQFSPDEIHFEPIYLGGRTVRDTGGGQGLTTGLDARQADAFAAHYLEARAIARQYGILLLSSGSRLSAIHGPYCNVFRETLTLVPGGVATACFKLTEVDQIAERGAGIGALNQETGQFEVDYPGVQALRQKLAALPSYCSNCFNRYHCARECPDRCSLDGSADQEGDSEPGFRCRVQKTIASAILQETADHLWSEAQARQTRGPYGRAIV